MRGKKKLKHMLQHKNETLRMFLEEKGEDKLAIWCLVFNVSEFSWGMYPDFMTFW